MKYSSDKDMNKDIRQLIKEGWIFYKRKKHGKLSPPNHPEITSIVSSSPSDTHACSVFRREIRTLVSKLGMTYTLPQP